MLTAFLATLMKPRFSEKKRRIRETRMPFCVDSES